MAVNKPVVFKRGSTFSFQMAMPDNLAAGYFGSWRVEAQIRKEGSSSPAGLIADLSPFWADPATNTQLVIFHANTDGWPLGRAEMDVLFTSGGGQKVRSKTVIFDIQRGITK